MQSLGQIGMLRDPTRKLEVTATTAANPPSAFLIKSTARSRRTEPPSANNANYLTEFVITPKLTQGNLRLDRYISREAVNVHCEHIRHMTIGFLPRHPRERNHQENYHGSND